MKKKKIQIKNITKKELEKFYKIKLTKGEFVVIKSWATRDCSAGIDHIGDSVDYSSRYAPFRRYVRALSQFSDGTKRSKFNFNKSYEKNIENIYIDESIIRDQIYGDIENNYPGEQTFDDIEKEWFAVNRYKKEIKKKGNKYKKEEIEYKKEETEYKKPSSSSGFDPFFFIPDNAFGGFLILLFLTWLIFGVIFGGGDLDPGAPRFFGHDGG